MESTDTREEHSTMICVNGLTASIEKLTIPVSNAAGNSRSNKDENTHFSHSCEKAISVQLEEGKDEKVIDTIDIIAKEPHYQKKTSMIPQANIPVPIYIDSRPSSSSDNGQEDEHSVSSLESLEDFPAPSSSERPSKRIFADYWNHSIEEEGSQLKQKAISMNTTRAASYTLSKCSQDSSMPIQDEFIYQEFNRDFHNYSSNSTTDGYEEILKENEIGRTSMPSSTSLKDANESTNTTQKAETGNKRSIFKNKYSDSVPSLVSYGYRCSNMPVRKTSSTSSLRKKQRSCLRSRSLSVDSTAMASLQSSSSRLSVSFDSRVCVHEYEKPLQRYTGNGWSKWFA
mmetsp:Transcript_132/g.190  ORF Transcript_132/g.190 Transcript_132/m.190 type:complete len:342 (-) Transcript_132:145-1170(-)